MQKQQEQHMKKLKKCNVLGPCASIFTSANTGSWRLERPHIDFDACVKCGTCQIYCPTDVITINKENYECVHIDLNYCKGCGICANECPTHCITMIEERSVK